jgi:hypothetical protein
MAYIIKNTSGLINTRLTDVGRRYISQGNFNIAYFQIGDSEVNYSIAPSSANYKITDNNILMPAFNAQNDTGTPRSNKQNIKYPYYVQGGEGNTYGIPYVDSQFQSVYNSAGVKGFFTTGGTQGSWTAQTSSAYTITSNYVTDMTTLSGQTDITVTLDTPICSSTTGTPSVNDFITILLDPNGGCGDFGTFPILTYKIQNMSPATGTTGTTSYILTLDRAVPDYSTVAPGGSTARVLIYPSGMTELYDTITPAPNWQVDTLNFESPCDVTNRENTVVWNMNIPWSVSPAGVFSSTYEDYTQYGSISYIGTKEYLGYQETSGQTDNSIVFYYNSFDEQIILPPDQQKAIAIIHYTNQDIDNVYGEKFATTPFDPQNPTNNTGLARNFKLTIPTLMWHKSTGATIGQTFFIDPPGYDNLCRPYYIKSTKNIDMNDPGIRYYHLWDTNPDSNGNLNRIGKVFPDQQIVVIDDEEVIAAMSYKANRNWTLTAPKLSLLTPNTCFTNSQDAVGILTNSDERMWVTYRLDSTGFTNSLHCNYYSVITGPDTGCTIDTQNVAVRFGNEFPFLSDGSFSDATLTGYSANSLKLLCQFVSGNTLPNPTNWVEIDVTDQLTGSTVNGYLTVSGLTGTTFQITNDLYYNSGVTYNLANYIDIPENGFPELMNFGDEFYFYGNLETDITATIYEMRYLINLGRNQFTNTSNPTWTSGTTSYVTEIGLYNSFKDLIVISKLQSPQLRQGTQQIVVKLDF